MFRPCPEVAASARTARNQQAAPMRLSGLELLAAPKLMPPVTQVQETELKEMQK